MSEPILEARGLTQDFPLGRGGKIRALDDVSLAIVPGEFFGLVGESGAGKSTLGRCFLGLRRPDAGELLFQGYPVVSAADQKRLRQAAGMIFQDPAAAMNPRMPVFEIVAEPLRIAKAASGAALRARVSGLLMQVGLDEGFLARYPGELSGGQQQRVCIARALACDPLLLVADEPVASLDVSAAAQIANLLMELRRRRKLACLFISHDLSMVRHLCDRIGVLWRGRLVEAAPAAELCGNPRHPYTMALLAASACGCSAIKPLPDRQPPDGGGLREISPGHFVLQ
ncbi:MAG: ATP-binding cassette domain-containing protein [Anaerotruncus rubiinfantis]|uniref:ATP-binding cassette domain-containing protein n=1 Tax=Anaerotruncus rubiinfantis TaxID=1720200 RepID=UPI00311A9FBA